MAYSAYAPRIAKIKFAIFDDFTMTLLCFNGISITFQRQVIILNRNIIIHNKNITAKNSTCVGP